MKKTETTNFFMKNKISDFIYGIRVKNYQRKLKKGKIKEKEISCQSKGEIIFLCVMMAYPVIAFVLNYVCVVADSFALAFQRYDSINEQYVGFTFANFGKVFKDLFTEPNFAGYLTNSTILWLISTFINMPLSVLISFCIYKKIPFAGFFKTILFLPQIIPGMVWVLIYKYGVDYAWPIFFGPLNFLMNPKYDFLTLVIFQQWLSFGGGLIIYTGAMGRIDPALVEVGKLEGFNVWQELWYLTLPTIYGTISVPLTTCLTGILTASLPLFMFYGEYAREGLHTISYYLFTIVIGNNQTKELFPYSSAFAIVISLIASPVALLTKKVLEKVGPSED